MRQSSKTNLKGMVLILLCVWLSLGEVPSLKVCMYLQKPSNSCLKISLFTLLFFRNSSSWEQTEYGRELQHQLENDHRFEVKYNLPNDQLLKVLSGFDLCVVPSLWLETGPLVVLESFAAGVPVLGSRLGGIAELVRDGVDGLLF